LYRRRLLHRDDFGSEFIVTKSVSRLAHILLIKKI